MAITADYHMHSYFSGDSTDPMENMILKGIESGLKSMCFTEHYDMDYVYEIPEDEGIFELNTDSYLYELANLKTKYADKINVLFGVELGIQPHIKRELSVYARTHEFDFIIASSHLAHRKDPYYPAFYEGRSDEEAYREYLEATLENIKAFTNFDVYGHLDYAMRYGKTKDANYSYESFPDLFDEILTRLIENEKGLEINTKGLDCGLKYANPCNSVLKRYRELGGEIITVGSDAHSSKDIGRKFDKASEFLLECGFKYYTTFEKRVAEFHRL